MRLWRVSSRASFDGEGARRVGGRWSPPGLGVIYTSSVLALALLEFLVHLNRDRAPAELFAHHADLPDEVRVGRLDVGDLPKRWSAHPAPLELREVGRRWAEAARDVALSVPSAVLAVSAELVPEERNYLLNPAHPDFARIRIGRERFRVDPRLWGQAVR